MSSHHFAREPKGQPTGGQFAPASKPASGVDLSPTEAARGTWPSELLEETRAESVQHEGLTTGIYSSQIDGALVVQVDTDEARGRHIRIFVNDGDPVYDGDPEKDETIEQKVYRDSPAGPAAQLDKVLQEYHRMTTRIEELSSHLVASTVRSRFPNAKYVTLHQSDQGDYWSGGSILDSQENEIGDWVLDIEEADDDETVDNSIALSNLRASASYPFIPPRPDFRTYLDLEGAAHCGRT